MPEKWNSMSSDPPAAWNIAKNIKFPLIFSTNIYTVDQHQNPQKGIYIQIQNKEVNIWIKMFILLQISFLPSNRAIPLLINVSKLWLSNENDGNRSRDHNFKCMDQHPSTQFTVDSPDLAR